MFPAVRSIHICEPFLSEALLSVGVLSLRIPLALPRRASQRWLFLPTCSVSHPLHRVGSHSHSPSIVVSSLCWDMGSKIWESDVFFPQCYFLFCIVVTKLALHPQITDISQLKTTINSIYSVLCWCYRTWIRTMLWYFFLSIKVVMHISGDTKTTKLCLIMGNVYTSSFLSSLQFHIQLLLFIYFFLFERQMHSPNKHSSQG